MRKRCAKCKIEKSIDDFWWANKARGYRQSYCKPCKTKIDHNPVKEKARRQAGKTIMDAARAIPCMDCGICYPPYVMDFDHREPSQKEFTIGKMGPLVKEARLLAEIAKCDVVCANCHRIRTHNSIKEVS